MKDIRVLFAIISLLFILSACKKENNKSPVTTLPADQKESFARSLEGKWYVVKDSIQAYDLNTPIPFSQQLSFSNADYVVFNKDSTGIISSQVAYNALYKDYIKLYINPDEPGIPDLNFKYMVSEKDSTLSIPQINSFTGIGYAITRLTATSLELRTQDVITKYPHAYTFKQYIYFAK